VQSLISRVVAGVTPVLPMIKSRITTPTESQTRTAFPLARSGDPAGAGNGARAYEQSRPPDLHRPKLVV